MKSNIIRIVLLLGIPAVSMFGQIKTITVVDSSSNPIPFVNIYGTLSKFGEITNPEGQAKIELSKIHSEDTLLLSCIGYHSYKISRHDLLDLGSNIISLKSKDYQIAQVKISDSPIVFKKSKQGMRTKSLFCRHKFYTFPESPGGEYGITIKNNQICYIESVNFNLANVSHDSLIYEINIYNYENEILEPINEKRLFLTVHKKTKKGSIDIRENRIRVIGDYAITFEALEHKDYPYYINFRCKSNSNSKLLSKTESGIWNESTDSTPSIWCNVKCTN